MNKNNKEIIRQRGLSLIPKNDKGRIKKGAGQELGAALGLASGDVISQWRAGISKSYEDYLYQIAAFYGVSVEWLRGETDDPRPIRPGEPPEIVKKFDALDEHGREIVMLLLDAEYRRCTGTATPAAEASRKVEYIRHYLVPAAAGYASPIEGEDFEEIERPPGAPDGADFCITIRGDSMEPFIPDGSLAYVQRGAQLQEFDAGVFFVDGDVYCKQWCVDYAGTLHLLSANPKRQDANISIPRDAGRSCVCFGKVLLGKRLPAPIYD